jgi:hypothetical protein
MSATISPILLKGHVVADQPISLHTLEVLVIDLVGRTGAEEVRNHIKRQILGTKLLQLDDRQLRSVARARGGLNWHTIIIGKRYYRRLLDGRMPIERDFDLSQFNPIPMLLDHAVASPKEFVVAVRKFDNHVARSIPARIASRQEGLNGIFRQIPISFQYTRSGNA